MSTVNTDSNSIILEAAQFRMAVVPLLYHNIMKTTPVPKEHQAISIVENFSSGLRTEQ